jgi:predicted nucleic acid-binding protein
MPRLFVDTTAWIGLEVINDEHHLAAKTFRQGSGRTYQWVTTNWILWEAVAWLRRRAGHASAALFGERLLVSGKLEIITITPILEMSAWEIFRHYQDKDFGFIDCTSFAAMKALGLTTAFTFDEHFRQAGFRMLPQG